MLLEFDHGDGQAFGRAVDRGGESGRAATDHGDIDSGVADRRLDAEGGRDVGLPRPHEGSTIAKDHDRQGTVDPGGLQQGLPLPGLGLAERERHEEAREDVPKLAGRRIPGVADDREGHPGPIVLVRPSRERGREDGVELLVGAPERPRDPRVDLTQDDRLDGGVDGGEIGPVREEQPLGGGVQPPRPGEKRRAGLARHPVIGDDHRDRPPGAVQVSESFHRRRSGGLCRHVVIVAVSSVDGLEEQRTRRFFVVHQEDDRNLVVEHDRYRSHPEQ